MTGLVKSSLTRATCGSRARFFVYALFGPDLDASPYTQTGERVLRLAANRIRLVIGELRTDVTRRRP